MADIKMVELEDGEPEYITVRMPIEEAAFMTTLLGKQSGEKADELMTGGGGHSVALWNCFTGELFNRWYDGGVAEYVRDRSRR